MVISDPILVTPDSSSIELLEIDHEGDDHDASSLLEAAANAKRSWQTFSYKELALATNDFHPGLSPRESSLFFCELSSHLLFAMTRE
jgi:hypothetical protein